MIGKQNYFTVIQLQYNGYLFDKKGSLTAFSLKQYSSKLHMARYLNQVPDIFDIDRNILWPKTETVGVLKPN